MSPAPVSDVIKGIFTRDRGVFGGRLAHFNPCRVPRNISVLGGSDQEDVFEVVEVGPKRQLVQERLSDVGSVFQSQLVE